jgi:hypothetical protein
MEKEARKVVGRAAIRCIATRACEMGAKGDSMPKTGDITRVMSHRRQV